MYGNALSKYPVVPGSVWEFERGLFVAGSNQLAENQKHIPVVSGVYTDPPWNTGNMRMFYGFAGKVPAPDFSIFIENIFRLIKSKTGAGSAVIMYAGVQQSAELLAMLEAHGWKTSFNSVTLYGKPLRPFAVIGGSFYGRPPMMPISGSVSAERMKLCVANLQRAGARELFDPCCGKLDLLIAGLRGGMENVFGIELIPAKLALGLTRLEKMGYKIRRVA